MPLQNRVDPRSQLHAVASRGTFMGNRGRLHNTEQQIVSKWKVKPWITCGLSPFKDYKRPGLMMPNSYTELFFLDEPTAYAAGHRPCAQCRRPAYKLFKEAWARHSRSSRICRPRLSTIVCTPRVLTMQAPSTAGSLSSTTCRAAA